MITLNKIRTIAEEHNFYCKIDNGYALFEQSTPEGEDWCLEFNFKDPQDLFNQLKSTKDNFDVDEEVEIFIPLRGKNGVPSSITDLVEDARWKKYTLVDFVEALIS